MGDVCRRTALQRAAALLGIAALGRAGPSAAQPSPQDGGLYFQVYATKRGEFRWRLKAANHKTIATSGEAYRDKRACLHAITLIKEGASAARIDDPT